MNKFSINILYLNIYLSYNHININIFITHKFFLNIKNFTF